MERSLEQREIVYTLEEAAKVLGVSRMSLYRYRQYLPDFPALPAFKSSLRGWAQRHKLPRRRGPLPGQRRKLAVAMKEDGKSFREIGRRLRISPSAAWQHWRRHGMSTPRKLPLSI